MKPRFLFWGFFIGVLFWVTRGQLYGFDFGPREAYVQALGDNKATIVVEIKHTKDEGLPDPNKSKVYYRTPPSEGSWSHTEQPDNYTAMGTEGSYDYYIGKVPLTGLSENSVYEYKVWLPGNIWTSSDPHKRFRTLIDKHYQYADETTAFNFLALGDNRPGSGAGSLNNIVKSLILREFPSSDYTGSSRAKFILHSGGFVNADDDFDEWHGRFLDGFADLSNRPLMQSICMFPSPGNHEAALTSSPRYFGYLEAPTYSGSRNQYVVDYNVVRIISLGNGHRADITSGSWLGDRLEEVGNRWCVVFFHIPYWNAGGHDDCFSNPGCTADSTGCIMRRSYDAWQSYLNRHGRTEPDNRAMLVICGHDHDFQRIHSHSIPQDEWRPTYVISGGFGAPLHFLGSDNGITCQPSSNTRDLEDSFDDYYHYLNVEIDRNEMTVTVWRCYSSSGNQATELSSHSFTIAHPGQQFKRADSNDSGTVDISDSMFTLNYLFGNDPSKYPPPNSFDSADADDNGDIDISDPIYTNSYLFEGGPEPPGPGPTNCGTDPTTDDMDSWWYESCR